MNIRLLVLGVSLVSLAAVADVTRQEEFSFELADGGRISLENVNGDVTVKGGDGSQVEIVALKKAGKQEYLDGIEIRIDHSVDAIRIETRHPDKGISSWFDWGSDSSGSVTYTLSVPASANLDAVETVNGDLSIAGVTGVVKASTVNGDVKAKDLSADARVETVNGEVDITFASFTGNQKADCESVNGRLVVNLPADASASVNAETINGGIDGSDFGLKTNKGFVGQDMSGAIGEGSGRLSLSTVNGSIKVKSGN
ncbi:MAG TPA: DUF4097 family beta strand repeat-containing protein [Xanthomonadales bacterium]|nr:DUF4097 family beta strand repeat-containing protein [Xanthomonadales bacterium]